MSYSRLLTVFLIGLLICSCKKEDEPEAESNDSPKLNIQFIMSSEAERLDNAGNPVTIPNQNAAQNPDFEILGLHYIGLFENELTPFSSGEDIFSSPSTMAGGENAIDFNQELFLTESENTYSIPLSSVSAGNYEYLRCSIGFQKFGLVYNLGGAADVNPNWPSGVDDDIDIDGTIASFLGFNTFIEDYTIVEQTVSVNGNRLQGYFGLESSGNISGFDFSNLTEGDAPQTTVPNPISSTSPVPAGSCVVTGLFPEALSIPSNPTEDINVQVIISINNSFEWVDTNSNGKYEPLLNEQVVDMGTRGVFPSVQ